MVGRQTEGFELVQLPPPVVELFLQAGTRQPGALPGGIVRILLRKRREHLAGIQVGQLAHQDAKGPAVEGDVVNGDEQQVLVVADLHDGEADHRAVLEVEGRLVVGDHEPLARFDVAGSEMVDRDLGTVRRQHHLVRLAIVHAEDCPQRFVPLDELGDGESPSGRDRAGRSKRRLIGEL